jgi:hypothetical protein
LGSGPSARGESDAAAGGSTKRAITATWLWAISCAKVSETAEQNGHADAGWILAANGATSSATSRHRKWKRNRGSDRVGFLMAEF